MMHAVMLCEDVSLPSHANCKNLLGSVEVTWRGERGEDTHLCSRMFHPSLSLSLCSSTSLLLFMLSRWLSSGGAFFLFSFYVS
jgi:hypothetical protein